MDNKTKEFLQKLKDSGNWNDDYDYSELVFKGKTFRVCVVHKEFQTKHLFLPKNLLAGQKCSTRNLLGGKKGYKSVEDALKFIHSLKLKNTDEWLEFRKTDKLPLIEKTIKIISKCQLLFALNNFFSFLIIFPNEDFYF